MSAFYHALRVYVSEVKRIPLEEVLEVSFIQEEATPDWSEVTVGDPARAFVKYASPTNPYGCIELDPDVLGPFVERLAEIANEMDY